MMLIGGPDRDRTDDPLDAMELSIGPLKLHRAFDVDDLLERVVERTPPRTRSPISLPLSTSLPGRLPMARDPICRNDDNSITLRFSNGFYNPFAEAEEPFE